MLLVVLDTLDFNDVAPCYTMTTFVTAFIDLNEDRSDVRSVNTYLEKFEQLVRTGVNLHVFVSSSYSRYVTESQTLKKTIIELEDLDTYKTLQGIQYELPTHRTSKKDTERYFILMNAKTEFLEKSIRMNLFKTNQYAWIDFGIFHVLNNSAEQVKWLGRTGLPKGLYVPGCVLKNEVPFTQVCWRFCGGFFIGDQESILEFNSLYKQRFRSLVKEARILTWEVNIWAKLELEGWNPIWYPADHNDTILMVCTT
jgi:hypothetical protein